MPLTAENPHQLAQAVIAEAYRLGFTLVGITNPEPPPHGEAFVEWLKREMHGEMAYLSTPRSLERRQDPRQILPECQCILALGIPYPAPASAPAQQGYGRVAAYAWGDDYHEVLTPRLQALVAFVENLVERRVPNRWYTDTGPVLERDLAQRAGLGWIGKNTCLINPRAGSYFLLAEVLLGIPLEVHEPFAADRCGSCTRCLEACPTGCILPNRTLDARRCISYLTIELKGSIPVNLRPQLGNWVFGCDICQQVCPWNQRFASHVPDPELMPQAGVPQPGLVEALSMDTAQFNQCFKRSPIRRAKRRGYLRNVAVALGNAGDASAVPALAQVLLQEAEPLVRAHAAWALGRLGSEEAHRHLQAALPEEHDPAVQMEIRMALDRFDEGH